MGDQETSTTYDNHEEDSGYDVDQGDQDLEGSDENLLSEHFRKLKAFLEQQEGSE